MVGERVPKKLTCEFPQTLPPGFVLGPFCFCFHPKWERCWERFILNDSQENYNTLHWPNRKIKYLYWKQQQWKYKEFMCFDSQKVYTSHVEINEILDFTTYTFLPVQGCKEKRDFWVTQNLEKFHSPSSESYGYWICLGSRIKRNIGIQCSRYFFGVRHV